MNLLAKTVFILRTPRLVLVQTPLELILRRLKQDDFYAPLNLGSGAVPVHFTPGWPGDALGFFAAWAEWKAAHPLEVEFGGGTVVHALEHVAIGQLGFKGPPNESGSVEVGFGFHPDYWRQGYATEMVCAQVDWALEQAGVYRVVADCLSTNAGSIRVLEKCSFTQTGERWDDDEGGLLLLWERLKV